MRSILHRISWSWWNRRVWRHFVHNLYHRSLTDSVTFNKSSKVSNRFPLLLHINHTFKQPTIGIHIWWSYNCPYTETTNLFKKFYNSLSKLETYRQYVKIVNYQVNGLWMLRSNISTLRHNPKIRYTLSRTLNLHDRW